MRTWIAHRHHICPCLLKFVFTSLYSYSMFCILFNIKHSLLKCIKHLHNLALFNNDLIFSLCGTKYQTLWEHVISAASSLGSGEQVFTDKKPFEGSEDGSVKTYWTRWGLKNCGAGSWMGAAATDAPAALCLYVCVCTRLCICRRMLHPPKWSVHKQTPRGLGIRGCFKSQDFFKALLLFCRYVRKKAARISLWFCFHGSWHLYKLLKRLCIYFDIILFSTPQKACILFLSVW